MGVTPESQPCHLRNGSEDASDIRVQYIRAMIRKYVSASLDLSLKAVHTGLESSIGGGLVVEGVGVGEISTQTGGLLMRRLVLALSTQEVTVAVYLTVRPETVVRCSCNHSRNSVTIEILLIRWTGHKALMPLYYRLRQLGGEWRHYCRVPWTDAKETCSPNIL